MNSCAARTTSRGSSLGDYRALLLLVGLLSVAALFAPPSSPLALPSLPAADAGPPLPPLLTTQQPTDGEHIAGLYSMSMIHTYPSAVSAKVRKGAAVLWSGSVQYGSNPFSFDSKGLPNGPQSLSLELHDQNGLITTYHFSVYVWNPVISATYVADDNSDLGLEVSLEGLTPGGIYVVLASDRLATNYFPAYGMSLPISANDSQAILAGIFSPQDPGSQTLDALATVSAFAENEALHLVLLTYTPDTGWSRSKLITVP